MRPADIEKLVSVGRPTIAPDGAFAVFATSRPDAAANRNVGQLWRVELDGADAAPRRLTRGVADAAPRLSPDGTLIAFLRGDAKDRPQVHVMKVAGGEPVQVTDQPLGVGGFSWSPDGARIAFTARVPEAGRYGQVEGLDAASEAPRHITGVRWEANGLGYMADRPAQVFIVDVPDPGEEPLYAPAPAVVPEGAEAPVKRVVPGEARQLTFGDVSWSGVVFTADGTEVLSVPDVIETDRRDLRARLVALSVGEGGSGTDAEDAGAATEPATQREVISVDANLSFTDIAVADDGTIAVLANDVGRDGVDFVAPGVALFIVDGTDGALRRLTDPETIDLGEVGSHITPIGDRFLVQNRTRGRVELLEISRDGEVRADEAEVVFGGDVEVAGHAASVVEGSGERIVVAYASPDSFGELALVGSGTLTDFGASLQASGISEPRELTVTGRDGYPVHGWVAAPEGEGPHPVILMIHGGPYAAYGIHAFDEVQTLVDAGYAVAYCNPRGSAGYGREHGRSIRQAMGTVDFHDVIDFLEGAVASDARLDGSRVGVMGGSYGGYLTAWVIAHDHRFAGAIVERGFLDPVSFQGTSDIGSFFGDEYVGTDAAAMAAQSPMAVVDQVKTPTFVVHSELDFRCPLEQATRYYSALKRGGVDAEMLIFPGENHELTRGGRPRHRLERFDAVLDWWARVLPVG